MHQVPSRHANSVADSLFTATFRVDLTHFNGHALHYDPNGNLVERETDAGSVYYTWDAGDRLIAIQGPHGYAAFRYDHAGRRIEKTVNGHSVQYLYDGLQAVAELQGGALGAVYHTGLMIDEVLARYSAEGDRAHLTDLLGSVLALTDEDGSVSTRYHYSPYGEVLSAGEASDNPLQYTGRENDQTGLYYYRARYYDPVLKRFVSRDPIGLGGGLNFYAYVGGSPIGYVDPEGQRGQRSTGGRSNPQAYNSTARRGPVLRSDNFHRDREAAARKAEFLNRYVPRSQEQLRRDRILIDTVLHRNLENLPDLRHENEYRRWLQERMESAQACRP
ncbi:RHS repeat-associated core domain-containing protein [Ectothiorhodospiraceae bacterium 2226]|nr:RHS repeat-associated core domain-containing protein [Ectothiorhodospiraceae bacterium 2226]